MESEEQLYAAYSPIASNNTILDDSTVVTNISELLTNSQAIITDNLEKCINSTQAISRWLGSTKSTYGSTKST